MQSNVENSCEVGAGLSENTAYDTNSPSLIVLAQLIQMFVY